MNYVHQANTLSKIKKLKAEQLLKQALCEVVRKDYSPMHSDAFLDLSSLFGLKWLEEYQGKKLNSRDFNLYAESNNAFNYANLNRILKGYSINLVKHKVPDENRISDDEVKHILDQLCFLLTNTTDSKVEEKLNSIWNTVR